MYTTRHADRLTLAEPLSAGIPRIMVNQLDQALLSLEGLNPDIHAARKAMKRVRGLLRLIREPLGESGYRENNDALRDAARALASARDATATIGTFDMVVAHHPRILGAAATERFASALENSDQTERARLATDPTVMPSVVTALIATRERLSTMHLTAPPNSEGGSFRLIEGGLRRTYRRCRKGIEAVRSSPSEKVFHRWRKDVKYLRYQLETLVAYSPQSLGEVARELDALGELLGSSQDLVVLERALREVTRSLDVRAFDVSGISSLTDLMVDELAGLHRSAAAIGETLFDRPPRSFVASIEVAFTKPEHVRVAQEAYGIVGWARPLPSEIDDIARIDTSDGRSYVIRFSPASTDTATPNLCDAATQAAIQNGIPAPRPVRTTGGATRMELSDGRTVRLQTWIPGDHLASLPLSRELAVSVGGIAGALVNALSLLPEPDESRDCRPWDLSCAAATISRLFDHVTDARRRDLVQDALDRIERIPFDDLPQQAIHNDLNPENLLVTDDRIVGVIDFGDVAWGVRVGELAISCAYAMIDQDDPIDVAETIASAYATETSVSPIEARWLFHLIVARLATSACIAASRPAENPHHQNTAEGVWNLLGTLLAADTVWITDRLTSACLDEHQPPQPWRTKNLAQARAVLGSSLRLSYDEPLHITRGHGQYLYDAQARRFLDGVNNVAHVGHANPLVIEAADRQASKLNTNTRYLHHEVLRYASRLADTLPRELDTVFLVNSGSEANELALRIARSATRRSDLVCIDHGYHGNTGLLVDVSPYKFNGPGGTGQREGIIVLPSPDPYRNPELEGERAGATYRTLADEAIGTASPAALIVEALPGCGGQLIPSPGVMAAAYDAVRHVGGLVIADEVQTGLGRVGTEFWAFELHGVVPDIVTIGKPAGNGHPLAAVVTTSTLADAFDNGMEYFNTFGGNPVSAAVGNAVLDVIERDRLQARARIAGELLVSGLSDLGASHAEVGDVRGRGLFIGVELVVDRDTKAPNATLASAVVEFARSSGVLLSTDGPHHNVIKIKPPLVVTNEDCDRFISTIEAALNSRL